MNSINENWQSALSQLPLIAILRGVTTTESIEVATVLIEKGFRCIEVPLNSPDALRTIEVLATQFGQDVIIGAGTVLSAESVIDVINVGSTLVVAPNLSRQVAQEALRHDCIYCPGVATPSEAFDAIGLGASALKLFPAEMLSPTVIKAMRAVLPAQTLLLPVGGINPHNMGVYKQAGADGFGLGSGLYKPGKSISEIASDAVKYVVAWQQL